jgi:hypothetical protein
MERFQVHLALIKLSLVMCKVNTSGNEFSSSYKNIWQVEDESGSSGMKAEFFSV